MASTTRTLGPLHLEDLEPHRFEDMVRQLLYDFRPWRELESTGRAGSDDSFDVRGWEIVPRERDVDEDEPGSEGDPASPPPGEDIRQWLVQCKRERNIGPTKLERYLDDIPEDERPKLHGLVFAAACDFSKTARDRFRTRAREFGLAEAYLWGRGELEDMLFQPKNDHLLFAYFGISLQVRRRKLKTEVRSRLAIKRKALRHLERNQHVLVRDASDDRYPRLDEDEKKDREARGSWRVITNRDCVSNGIRLVVRRHFAFLDDDGEHWDYAERVNLAETRGDPWTERDDDARFDDHSEALRIWDALEPKNQAYLEIFRVLPYENVLDIDENGDEWFSDPHIYTTPFDPVHGPFRPHFWEFLKTTETWGSRRGTPDEAKRVEKFPRK